ncbi:tRNA (adenosine(37)-N6)-threonylcarbamoyltransferase complex dimerization subunit type 1 TsaB [Azospira sp. APE16]|jgi:tRNA threonylcarbamoyladenosine biosynthesis protein TsaB|uniref:Universal bacterial protein YeaZ n=1 Tax=Azospira oryzae (strain ATCC BAA-33 / DSM 13638 / PS) TaxID=640081 RepID=G8QLX3_AZOOP|nr:MULTISPECIES: tRNA (adenosine(37)-N6)-threonylcarbamoyltransferase complex dimerization subunit type 1 TsaB [Azospira]AEV26763.1 universal bacterial protein YeaZ [Azospira oryzae PS]MBP7488329.1 tRNA (adenosine(37)-N6)-threonylcarbamoyltransferase complex dimerization subunit type 1 TsaB [Azospira sp.]MDK9692156.1 tRNA (adenosine(37)-N6)-threonylcarbamoyltransferase complex dimerization subunit type 1 TsaB [Azospira sp.]TLS19975.1 MAG: tRNA (adenosine(37)-N6)-threonylcarbamoyltransferase com
MNLLALETATDQGSVALWRDGVLLSRECPAGEQSSLTLLPLVRAMMAEAGLAMADLDGIAFGAGPGAFTGLRVACGVAQGLAVALDRPVLPVVTLEAMAYADGSPQVAVYLDARMNEVYCGAYRRVGEVLELQGAITVCPPAEAPLPAAGDWAVCGNGVPAYPALSQRLAAWPLGGQRVPTAAAVARLAAPRLARGEGLDPALAAPLYIRDKVALTVAERLAQGGRA